MHEGSKVDPKEVDARQTHGVVGSLKLKPAEMEVVEAHEDFSEEVVNEVVGTDGAELEESPAIDLETSQDGFLERNQVQTNQKPTESKKWRRRLKKESCRCKLLKKINCSNIMLKILLNMESSNMAKILRSSRLVMEKASVQCSIMESNHMSVHNARSHLVMVEI